MIVTDDKTREATAISLAYMDGIILKDIRSTVGPAEDANNWRKYLGRADDFIRNMASQDVALSAAPAPEATAVKPLEWVDGTAACLFGSYTIHKRADSMWEAVGYGSFVDGPHDGRVLRSSNAPDC